MIRWWPAVGLTAMVLLGWVVGKSSTGLDDWFHQYSNSPTRDLRGFTDPLALAVVVAATVAFALYRRRWLLAGIAAVLPYGAYLLVQVIKPFFGRDKGGGLAYPSGHITTTTVVLGLFVLVTGCALWALVFATVYVGLAVIGVGTTFHYFTDTIGGVLLGTSLVCIAALLAAPNLTRVNTRATWVTRGG
ncbi:phosphoesterase PA-phosphatase [Mycolicibacterium holsaticum]|nr:phosphoesterase PA-phosphatase [Mycolicibacterium holsaticum]